MSIFDPTAPLPFGPIPSPRQIQWHALELYGFLHFTVNTFTDLEWGYGDESPNIFNPTAFDADQIVETAANGGLRGLILTCKHHDGFCLWPSRYTDHSVRNSPWRAGQGDVVREISEACRRRGLKFGVYLSPWDRNHPAYGYPEYIPYYRAQLRELLENYGPLFEIWFDGANGGSGYYGGARETRTIDKLKYYGWSETWQMVRDLQPEAVIFSDAGPDVRWVGNEDGQAGETCWATLNRSDFIPGEADRERLNTGDRPASDWLPAECDVSIRPGWFYHPGEDHLVKSPNRLFDLYFASVGRGGSLLLNLPPDLRGQIHPNDASALRNFHLRLTRLFSHNLARDAVGISGPYRAGVERFSPANLINPDPAAYWTCDDNELTPTVVFSFAHPVRFNSLSLREYLPLGQRISAFAIDIWKTGNWQPLTAGTSVGACRLLRFPTISTTSLRLRITQAAACPALSEFGLWADEQG